MALFSPLRDTIGIARSDAAGFGASKALFAGALRGQADLDTGATGLIARPSDGPSDGRSDGPWFGTVLSEAEGQCVGRGVYLFRSGQTVPLAITAPHRGSDRHTGTIAAALFANVDAAAAAWNSAPRNPSNACPHAIDLAREADHPFTAFALAFADRYPKGRIVQLHGFDRAKRDDAGSRSAGVIISDGTTNPGPGLLDLADCLSLALDPHPVRIFPLEAKELGALTNAQGDALRQQGFNGFVHLEMSADLREELTVNTNLRASLATCLAGNIG